MAPFSKLPVDPLWWTTNIAKWGLQLMLQLWDNRNSTAHQPTGNNAPILTYARLEAKVRERYSWLRSLTPPLSQSNTDAYFSALVAGQLHRKEVNQCTCCSQITYYFQLE